MLLFEKSRQRVFTVTQLNFLNITHWTKQNWWNSKVQRENVKLFNLIRWHIFAASKEKIVRYFCKLVYEHRCCCWVLAAWANSKSLQVYKELVDLQAMTVGVDQVCKGWNCVDWVPGDDYHFLGAEGRWAWDILWIVRFCDPNEVRVTCYILAK